MAGAKVLADKGRGTPEPDPRRAVAPLRRVPAYLPLAAIVGALAWPWFPLAVPPSAGTLDPSWQAGLHMAIHLGLEFDTVPAMAA